MGLSIQRISLVLLVIATFVAEGEAFARIRVMSANLTSGRDQSYDPGHGMNMIRAIKPDVVMIQEFNFGDNSDHDIKAFVSQTLGEDYNYYRENDGSASIPNGIISRFPISDAGVWTDPRMHNRGFVWAKIELADGRLLWAYSVHLSSKDSSRRAAEARALISYIKSQVDLDHDLILVGGDFNTPKHTEGTVQILQEIMGEEISPLGPDGKFGTNVNRTKPYDWLMANDGLDAHAVALDLHEERNEEKSQYNFFPYGMVFDSRAFPDNFFPGVRKFDSQVEGMQHMGVVKEFDVN